MKTSSFHKSTVFLAILMGIAACNTPEPVVKEKQALTILAPPLLPKTIEEQSKTQTVADQQIQTESIPERHSKREAESINYPMSAPIAPGMGKKARCGTTTQSVYYNNAVALDFNTESYNTIVDNEFLSAKENPLSTFSIDVDEASYTNCRRYINSGSLPPLDAVRTEEFINYFDYHYPQPHTKPVAIYTEVSDCPWNKENRLLHIGLQARTIAMEEISAMNLVFLVDVSGSMNMPNKLPLLKTALKLLTHKLRAQDRVSLVAYAGAAGLVLPPTSGADKNTIDNAIDNLSAGGSTAGGQGLLLAYKQAIENKIPGGVNRVILATDGDFNVGVSSDAEMTRIVEDKSKQGVCLTTLGFGMGNYKDSKMETMADHGDGNNFYIDNADEARKVLVTDIGSTLCLVAKDVKLQLEFNPLLVKGYRLVGYENRMLKKEDFNNDQKDAGDMGAGHTVTALYEIVPVNAHQDLGSVDPLKYQHSEIKKTANELLTIKLRYKEPNALTSQLIELPLKDNFTPLNSTSENFRFSAAVAEFGMLLHNSKFKGSASFESAWGLGEKAKGKDEEGYRAEFLKLVKTAAVLKEQKQISMIEE